MRAMQFEETDRAAAIAERDEILAHDAQPPRQVAQFLGQNDRLPEAPQIFAAGRARADPRQLLVLRRPLAMMVCAIGHTKKGCPLCQGNLLGSQRSQEFYQPGPHLGKRRAPRGFQRARSLASEKADSRPTWPR